MKSLRTVAVTLLLALVIVSPARVAPAAVERVNDAPWFAGIGDPASLKTAMDARLAEAQRTLERLQALKGPRTVENTLRPYDDIFIAFSGVVGATNMIAALHPDQRMRETASEILQRARTAGSDLGLNREMYDALAAIDVSKADEETQYYVRRELREFRLNGVDKDEATRRRIAQLRTDLAAAQLQFLANIRANTRHVVVQSAAELAGLPADFIARHKPDANGAVTLATDDSDIQPLLTFAKNEDVRKRMYMEWTNVGYPANIEVLDRMIAIRAELAHLLGFDTWAAYDMVNRMAGSVKAVSDFIDHVVEVSGPKAAREYGEILKRKQQDVPGATTVNAWENTYYSELVKRANYDFDAQSVRPYFQYDRVRQGLFDVTSKLYGVTFRPAKDVPVWHPSVEVFEMLENGALVGRFYFDTHPRPNKQSGGLSSATRSGVAGRQTPEVVLLMSVPGGQPGDPGLLSHDDVRARLFHEFGHGVHTMMSGRHQWIGVTRVVEADFPEAPSQLFEEWTWDPATLATFAKHHQTNEPIPAALVRRMRRASEFGKGLFVRQQMIVARLTLSLHDRDPKQVDSTALLREITNAYVPFKYVEGTHRQTTITQIANRAYSASYYTYMWSLVIAQDFFTQFDPANLLAPEVAHRYRDRVLRPAGSKPAADLVHDFLGRPFNASAWERWLNRVGN